MKSAIVLIILMEIGLMASNAYAKVWTLTPVETAQNASMSTNTRAGASSVGDQGEAVESGTASAYLVFDLAPVQTDGRPINIVYIEWPIDGARSDTVSTFFVYGVSDSASVDDSGMPTTREEDLIETWECSPLDIMRANGGLVICDISNLAKDWSSGTRLNRGIVIKTDSLSGSQLQAQIPNAKLVVR